MGSHLGERTLLAMGVVFFADVGSKMFEAALSRGYMDTRDRGAVPYSPPPP